MVGPGCTVKAVQSRYMVPAQNIEASKIVVPTSRTNTSASQVTPQPIAPGPTKSTASSNLSIGVPTLVFKDTNVKIKREATEELKEDAKRFCTSHVGDSAAEDIVVRLSIRIGKLEETIVEKNVTIKKCEKEIKRRDSDLQERNLESQTQFRKFKDLEKEGTERRNISHKQLQDLKDLEAKYKDLQSEYSETKNNLHTHVAQLRLLHAKGLERDQEISMLKTKAEGLDFAVKAQIQNEAIIRLQRDQAAVRVSKLNENLTVAEKENDSNKKSIDKLTKDLVAALDRNICCIWKRVGVEDALKLRDARITKLEESLKTAQGGLKTLVAGSGNGGSRGAEGNVT